jgi:transcriptional regulator with XRE-family HTH domain
MARTALSLTVRQAAELTGCSHETIIGIESGRSSIKQSTIDKVRGALEKSGVEFIAENGGGPGVRIRKSTKGAEEISRQIDALEDKISSMPAPTEPSPEAGMNIRKAVAKNDLAKKTAVNVSGATVRNKRHSTIFDETARAASLHLWHRARGFRRAATKPKKGD